LFLSYLSKGRLEWKDKLGHHKYRVSSLSHVQNGETDFSLFFETIKEFKRIPGEKVTKSSVLKCPKCKAIYSYTPEELQEGILECQNCGRKFQV
jgi:hypothetical protein